MFLNRGADYNAVVIVVSLYIGLLLVPAGTTTGRYGRTTETYGRTTGRYGRTTETYGRTTGRYGTTTGRYGRTTETYGRTTGRYGTTTGRYGRTTGRYGTTTGRYGRTTETYGTTTGRYGRTTGRYGRTTGRYGTTTGRYGRTTGRYGTTTGRYGTTTGTYGTTPGPIAFTTGTYGTTTGTSTSPSEQPTDTRDSDAYYTPLLALVIVHSVVIIVLIIFIVVCGIYISRKLRGLEHRPDIHEQIHASAHDTERGEVAETSDATTEFTELAEIYTNTPGNRNSEHIYSSLATVGEYANTTTATLSDGVSGELRGSRSQKKGRGKASWQKKGKAYERNESQRGQGVQAVESEANPDKLYVNMIL